jgi:hypothetical protein
LIRERTGDGGTEVRKEVLDPAHKKAVLIYLRLSGIIRGYWLNFGEALMQDGITRIVRSQVPPS